MGMPRPMLGGPRPAWPGAGAVAPGMASAMAAMTAKSKPPGMAPSPWQATVVATGMAAAPGMAAAMAAMARHESMARNGATARGPSMPVRGTNMDFGSVPKNGVVHVPKMS